MTSPTAVAAERASAATPPVKTMRRPMQTLEPRAAVAAVSAYVDAMSALASAVVLVTCRIDGRPWGMTVTAFCSISTEPPTVLVSLGAETAAARAIAQTGCFGVSILAEGQVAVARHGSRPGTDKYLERFTDSHGTDSASPVVADAIAHVDCGVTDRIRIADHVLFVGRVRAASSSEPETTPLLYHRRTYRRLGAYTVTAAPPGRSG